MSKTILVGLDGATFTVLDPLMANGTMPFLRDLVANGVRASLRSVIPPLTPPAWTTLMTGKRPGGHGVFDFFQKETPESRFFRFASSNDIQTATIWSLASDEGRRVTALNFPLMFPPPNVNGSVVPGGWMPWRQLRLGCHPAGLFDRLKTLPSFDPRELSHDASLEEKALEGCAAEEYADWIALHCRREQRWTEVLLYLMREEPADLTAVLFDGVDKLQHLCWRFIDPAFRTDDPTTWEQEIRRLCEGYFRQLDGLIARIVEQAGPEASVVFASDHGFGPSSDVVYLNTWLEQQGYLAWADDQAVQDGASNRVGISQIARHTFEMDWSRTIAYAATPSSQGIHIVGRDAASDVGVPVESYDRVRGELMAALRQFRHPVTGRPVVAEVWTREEAFPGPHMAMGPDLTVVLEGDAVVSILRSDVTVKTRPEPVGTHRPEGVFLAGGPLFRRGARLPEIHIEDVATVLLYCTGVSLPAELDGRLPLDAFDPEGLRLNPPRFEASRAPGPEPFTSEQTTPDLAYDAEEEALVLKRLGALGYLE
ncbi:alkaline phosphatase family protein [Isosphaeraceae bacterium EP7]